MVSTTLRALPLVALLSSLVSAACPKGNYTNSASSLTFLFQNNLNSTEDYNHIGAILLEPSKSPATACAALHETLLTEAAVQAHSSDFALQLSYLQYAKLEGSAQAYQLADSVVTLKGLGAAARLQFTTAATYSNSSLPILCTQSDTESSPYNAKPTATNTITISGGANAYIGFRDEKSFRFAGIHYANPYNRFEYTTVNNATGTVINATAQGPDCAQNYDSNTSEDCLFLNIQTPYIPRAGSKKNLKPVIFSIHGGGFTGGNGGYGSGQDGGNYASREDIVAVSINYRLSTLGFLAIPGTAIKGNFGIGDQITALRWVQKNIAAFGGDPTKVTIIGESAGAGSVRTLLGSPPVIAEKLIAGGIAQSNLGGGVALGLNGDYATTYSSYLTVAQSYAQAGQNIFLAVGCNQTTLDAQIACLKTVPANTIVTASTVARYVVQDGTIVNTEQLDVTNKNGSSAYVPIIFGTTSNDGASFSTYVQNPANETAGIAAGLGISLAQAQRVIDSGLFPYYNTGNATLDTFNVTQRVATDLQFRCIDEATVYAASVSGAFPRAYYYDISRTYQGYDPNNLGTPLSSGPVSAAFPNGDPELPYFRLHGSDLGFTYGNQYPIRDDNDIFAMQLITGYYGAFVKTGNPNPPVAYLAARGYAATLAAVTATGEWTAVDGANGTQAKQLDWPSRSIEFPEKAQCAFLGYGLDYYLNGGV